MKNILPLLLLFVAFHSAQAQPDDALEVEMVKNLVIQSFEDIWSTLDETKILDYHTEDFLLLEAGEVWTNETIAGYQERTRASGPVPTRTNRFEFIKVEKTGDSYWMAYHNYANWTLDGEDKGKAQWLESAVAIKTEKGWRLTLLHSTPVRK